jgi:hypothetical protein
VPPKGGVQRPKQLGQSSHYSPNKPAVQEVAERLAMGIQHELNVKSGTSSCNLQLSSLASCDPSVLTTETLL